MFATILATILPFTTTGNSGNAEERIFAQAEARIARPTPVASPMPTPTGYARPSASPLPTQKPNANQAASPLPRERTRAETEKLAQEMHESGPLVIPIIAADLDNPLSVIRENAEKFIMDYVTEWLIACKIRLANTEPGDIELIKTMLTAIQRTHPKKPVQEFPDLISLFFNVINKRDPSLMIHMLELYPKLVTALDQDGLTGLAYAIALIEKQGKVTEKERINLRAIIQMLVDRGSDLTFVYPDGKETLLQRAQRLRAINTVKILQRKLNSTGASESNQEEQFLKALTALEIENLKTLLALLQDPQKRQEAQQWAPKITDLFLRICIADLKQGSPEGIKSVIIKLTVVKEANSEKPFPPSPLLLVLFREAIEEGHPQIVTHMLDLYPELLNVLFSKEAPVAESSLAYVQRLFVSANAEKQAKLREIMQILQDRGIENIEPPFYVLSLVDASEN